MNPISVTSVRAALREDRERVIGILTDAFAADPVARWVWPEELDYLAKFPQFADTFGGRAFAFGSADVLESCGAALWLPPGVEPDGEQMSSQMETAVEPSRVPDLAALFEEMARAHPTEPHWYLPLIGVPPEHQGNGHGSALLRHALARCDAEQLPAYLESSNPRNIPLYERFGFVLRGRIQAGSSPPMFPMWRDPLRK